MKYEDLLKNEWVKTAIMLAIVLIAFFSFWFGIRYALATDYPLLAVASPSMVPTLNVGDLIVVHGVSDMSQIYTHYGNGDIIVFHTYLPGGSNLRGGFPDELIVHRAVNETFVNGVLYFMTKGDNNYNADPWRVPENYVVGKVVGSAPYIGYIPLYIRTPEGVITVIALIVVVVAAEFIFSSIKEKRKSPLQEATS